MSSNVRNGGGVRGKVFVGLSGGVDSAVSAYLLKEAGYDVVAVFIKVWQPDFLECTWRDDRRSAMRVAAYLEIPLLTLDLEQTYEREVVQYMVREYERGRVPNPDVMCNKYVKFGDFLAYAKAHGADYIATGHYAQIINTHGDHALHEGKDPEKDQSYFLWTLPKAELPYMLFPIGHLHKSAVRSIAVRAGLPNAARKDSQGLCFMGHVDIPDFLAHYLKLTAGAVLNTSGVRIGTHKGALIYTLGQRHGFRIDVAGTQTTPYYVIAKDLSANTITVDTRAHEAEHMQRTFVLSDTNVFDAKVTACDVRLRYHGERIPCSINESGVVEIAHEAFCTPGQSAVFYKGTAVVRGGVIEST